MASDDASTAEYAEVPLPEPSELAGSASEGDKKKVIDLLGIFTRRGQFSMPIGKRIKLVRVDVQPKQDEPRKLEVVVTTEIKVGSGTCGHALLLKEASHGMQIWSIYLG